MPRPHGDIGHAKVEETLAGIGVVCWAILGKLPSHMPGVALPYVDAATATTSLFAQYLMTRKLLENWTLWIIVDVVYVGMFIFKGLYLTAGTKVTLPDGSVAPARTLAGRDGLLFRRNSVTGAVEVLARTGVGVALNAALHAN